MGDLKVQQNEVYLCETVYIGNWLFSETGVENFSLSLFWFLELGEYST